MELPPTLFPSRLDGLGLDVVELFAQTGLAARVRVDGQRILSFLEALGMQLEQARRYLLPSRRRDRDRDPAELARAQRNALFSFSKNPSSDL